MTIPTTSTTTLCVNIKSSPRIASTSTSNITTFMTQLTPLISKQTFVLPFVSRTFPEADIMSLSNLSSVSVPLIVDQTLVDNRLSVAPVSTKQSAPYSPNLAWKNNPAWLVLLRQTLPLVCESALSFSLSLLLG